MNWILCEDPETLRWYSLPMGKCTPTRKHRFSLTIWIFVDCAITQGNASSPIAWETLRRPRILLWVGQGSKATIDQRNMQNGQFRTSCRSKGYPPVLEASRRQHRHCRILSTIPAQERSDELAPGDRCISPSKTQNKKWWDDNRDSDDRFYEIFRNG